MNKDQIMLSKESTENEIKAYFNAILKLAQSKEEFPVNLNMVWPLVYGRKEEAVRSLTSDFIESVDYQVLRKNAENLKGGRPINEYYLSVSCLEYFIARKVRSVFEVYRQVFHKATNSFQLPSSFSEALRLAAEQADKIEEQQKQLEAARPSIVYTNAVLGSKSSCLIGELAKILCQNGIEVGQNRLFKWLRDNNYLGKFGERYNIPNQKYIDQGIFELKQGTRSGDNGVMHTTITTKVTGKGQVYFVNKFINNNTISL